MTMFMKYVVLDIIKERNDIYIYLAHANIHIYIFSLHFFLILHPIILRSFFLSFSSIFIKKKKQLSMTNNVSLGSDA